MNGKTRRNFMARKHLRIPAPSRVQEERRAVGPSCREGLLCSCGRLRGSNRAGMDQTQEPRELSNVSSESASAQLLFDRCQNPRNTRRKIALDRVFPDPDNLPAQLTELPEVPRDSRGYLRSCRHLGELLRHSGNLQPCQKSPSIKTATLMRRRVSRDALASRKGGSQIAFLAVSVPFR